MAGRKHLCKVFGVSVFGKMPSGFVAKMFIIGRARLECLDQCRTDFFRRGERQRRFKTNGRVFVTTKFDCG